MEMKALIKEALRAYRQYGRKLHVPQVVKTIERPDYVRMSSLGMCPLKAAREKLGIIPDIPELTYAEDDDKAWLMDRGNYTAAQIQEALMFYAMTQKTLAFEPEVEILDEELKLTGRADGIVRFLDRTPPHFLHGADAVIEIKDTEGIEKRSVGEPKISYAYQVMAYMRAAKLSVGYIVTTSKWGWSIYEVRSHGDYFLVYDEYDRLYTPPSWIKSPNWNTSFFLSWSAWEYEVSRHHNYLLLTRDSWDHGQSLQSPILDPLNDEGSWQCVWHYEKPTKNQDGEVKPVCPWATSCHGLHARVYKTVKTDGMYRFKETE